MKPAMNTGTTRDRSVQRQVGPARLRVLTRNEMDKVTGGQPMSAFGAASAIAPVFRNQEAFYSEGFAPTPRRHWRVAIALAVLSIAFVSLGFLWGTDRTDGTEATPSSSRNIGEAPPRQDSRWAAQGRPGNPGPAMQ